VHLHSSRTRRTRWQSPELPFPVHNSSGSRRSFHRRNCSHSAGENCTHMEFNFSTPHPVSPVTVPPVARVSEYRAKSSQRRISHRDTRSHATG